MHTHVNHGEDERTNPDGEVRADVCVNEGVDADDVKHERDGGKQGKLEAVQVDCVLHAGEAGGVSTLQTSRLPTAADNVHEGHSDDAAVLAQ